MRNTTTGLNVAEHSLLLKAGQVVLTFDKELPSVITAFFGLKTKGVTLEQLAPMPEGWPDE